MPLKYAQDLALPSGMDSLWIAKMGDLNKPHIRHQRCYPATKLNTNIIKSTLDVSDRSSNSSTPVDITFPQQRHTISQPEQPTAPCDNIDDDSVPQHLFSNEKDIMGDKAPGLKMPIDIRYPKTALPNLWDLKPLPTSGKTMPPSPILPVTEADMIAGSSQKNPREPNGSTDLLSGKNRNISSSTLSQSRFFPAGSESKKTVTYLGSEACAPNVLNSSTSSVFPRGLTGFSGLPSTSSNIEETNFQQTASREIWARKRAQHSALDRLSDDDQNSASHNSHAPDDGYAAFLEPHRLLNFPLTQQGASGFNSQSGRVVANDDTPSHTTTAFSESTDLGPYFPAGDHVASSKDTSREAFLASLDSAGPNHNTLRSTTSLSDGDTSMQSAAPRGATSIEKIERVADITDAQKSLTVTRPGQSWVTELSDWRSPRVNLQRQGGSQVGGANPAGFVPPSDWVEANSTAQQMGPQDPRLGPGSEQDVGQSLIQGHLPKIWGPEDGSSIEKRHRIFKPMTAVLYPKAPKRPLSDQERALRQQKGISDNYEGNPENPKNQSANIPNEENCALFLTNLPARCSYQTLLRAIAQHRMGRVWSTYINSPLGEEQHEHQQRQAQDPSPAHHYGASMSALPGPPPPQHTNRGPLSHRTSAAKVIFYHPTEAQRLLTIASRGDFRVGGRRIHAKWNRHRTAAQSYENPTSRVVVISGPAAIVDRQWLGDLFDQYFEYQTEEVLVLAEGNGWRTLEWRFGSMRAQAHSAHQLLRSLYPGVVTVKWAVDPCAGYLKLLGEV